MREIESPRLAGAAEIAVQIAFKAKICAISPPVSTTIPIVIPRVVFIRKSGLDNHIASSTLTTGKTKIGSNGQVLQTRMQKRPLACAVIERMGHRNADIHAAIGFERRAGAKRTPFLSRRVKIVSR